MSNKDIETNINENTEKSETPKKKNIVHVFRPQNTQNGGNKGRRSGGNRQNSGQGKQMQANNGRPAKRPAADVYKRQMMHWWSWHRNLKKGWSL